MHPKYPHIFTPIKLGPVQLGGRFFFASHGLNMVHAGGNEPSNDLPFFDAERARGGVHLLIQSQNVHGGWGINAVSPFPKRNIESFRVTADRVHEHGARLFAQLWYFWGLPGQWWPLAPQRPVLSPSRMQQVWGNGSTHQIGKEEIRRIIAAHRQSAANLREAGYDGVELHVAHGALLEQMLSPYFNNRTDEYGGILENRMRLLLECLEAAREGAGPDMAVGIRFNCDELLPGGVPTGYGREQAKEILRRLSKSGLVDFFDLSLGIEPNQIQMIVQSVFVEKLPFRSIVQDLRASCGPVPVMSVLGRLNTVQEGEQALADGVCDMVGTARGLIAEPDLVANARDGREHLSRTCIHCDQCMESAFAGNLSCAINPASFRERLWGQWASGKSTATPSRVVIVGGGPAGMEAARVAALQGHEVVLFEGRGQLGGGLRIWATLPDREVYQLGVDWWTRELDRLGVDVRLGITATADMVLAEKPDAVLVATGARYSRTGRCGFLNVDMEGHDRNHVHTVEDIYLGGKRPTGKVVLVDGEGLHTSLGIAEILAAAGARVELVTTAASPISINIERRNESPFYMKRLKDAGVVFSTHSWVRRISERSVTLYDVFSGRERRIGNVNAVVLATSRVAQDGLVAELDGKVKQLFAIGDALAPRPMYAASYEGQMFARFIGEEGAPSNFAEAYFMEPDISLWPAPAASLLAATDRGGAAS